MRKLAYEAGIDSKTFNDPGACLGKVKQMLGAMREQLRDERDLNDGQVVISILVRHESTKEALKDHA